MNKIKNLFATPKKAVISAVCIVAALGAVIFGTNAAMTAIAKENSITSTEAENIALTDAGVERDNAYFERTEFDREDGIYVYEIEFRVSDTSGYAEYDYVVRASDGTILEKDIDGAVSSTTSSETAVSTADTSVTTTTTTTDTDGLETAKSTALADANLTESDVTFTKAKLDNEDGQQTYDIEFYTNEAEYDYEISASDYTIVDKSVETFTTSSSSSTSTYIGTDKAKEIVLADAGYSESEVTFVKVKLENDDGAAEYEVEFYVGTTEYEYTLDASTGAIKEYSRDTN